MTAATLIPAGTSPDMIGLTPLAGDFFVVQGDSCTARATGLGTSSQFSHTGLCDGRGNVIEAMGDGVQRTPISQYDGFNMLISTGFIRVAEPLRGTVLAAGESLLGTPYDYTNIAYLIARRLLHRGELVDVLASRVKAHWPDDAKPSHVICSALVTYAWREAGIDLIEGKEPWQVTPGDLASVLTRGRIPADY